MNDTTTLEEDETEITFINIGLCLFSFALMIFVCAGNILTLVAIARTSVLRTLANIYVFSLAIADLVVGLGISMIGMFMLPPIKREYFDRNINLCVFMQGVLIGTLVTSSFHMTLISFDRYIYITRPYSYPRIFIKRNIFIILTAIWIFGVAITLIPQFAYKDISETQDCDMVLTLPVWYLFYLTTFTFLINIVVACVFYSQILLAAIKQRKAIQATTATIGTISTDQKDGGKKEPHAQSSKVGLKSIKFFFTIFGFYFVCVTPCFIAVAFDIYSSVHEDIVRAGTLIVMLNSGMNFIIYVVLNKQFKRAFSDILHCRPSSQ